MFKYEGGTHRVQRVPETESQGRIHTSTATVAVLPEAEEVDVEIDQNDLQIDVYRSSGPGGQSVNTTDSAVRITHKPTGILVSMQDEKSQLQNREKAMRVLRARLYEARARAQQAELAADRKSQVGTGERAEKIRTYNFPERRVTDHRIKLTVHNLDEVLAGELDEFTAALQADEKRRAARGRRSLMRAAAAGRTTVATRWTPRSSALEAAGCDTPQLDAEVLLADALRRGAHGAVPRPGARARARRGAPAHGRSSRAAPSASRSPTSSGRGLPPLDLPSTAACSSRARRPSTLVEAALDAAAGRAGGRRRHGLGRDRAGAQARAPGPAVSATDSPPTRSRSRARTPSGSGLEVEWRLGDLLVPATSTRSSPTRPTSPTREPLPPDDRALRAAVALLARRRRARRLSARLVAAGCARPFVALEVGDGQAARVAALMRFRGYVVESMPDLAGIERVVVG